jgi:hypothetical protein
LLSADSDEDHVQPEGDNVDFVPTFEATSSSIGAHLLTQSDIKDLLHDTNLSRKPSRFLTFQTKRLNLIHKDIEIFFFKLPK